MEEVPSKVKTVGILYLVAGVVNLTMGIGIASAILTFAGGFCTGVITLGMCPFGVMCGFVPLLILPLAFTEIIVGLLALVSPETVKPVMGKLPYVQFGSLLLGDLASPIVGAVAMSMLGDPEVRAYIEGF